MNVAQQAMQQAQKEETEALCILNLITMPEAQQVVLEVKVAQIDKTKLKQLGISYLIKTDDFVFAGPGLFTNVTGTIGEDLLRYHGVHCDESTLPGIQACRWEFDLDYVGTKFYFSHFPG